MELFNHKKDNSRRINARIVSYAPGVISFFMPKFKKMPKSESISEISIPIVWLMNLKRLYRKIEPRLVFARGTEP